MPRLYANVAIGEGAVIADDAVIGLPPRGAGDGERAVIIGPDATIRSGTVIYGGVTIGSAFNSGHGALIREDNIIGDHCSVGSNAMLEPHNVIGNYTRIHSGCFLERVTLGNHVFVGPNVTFTDDPHPPCVDCTETIGGAILEDGVSVGGNATLMPGVRIGAGSLIGGGSVVTKSFGPGVVIAGNPARVLKATSDVKCRVTGKPHGQ